MEELKVRIAEEADVGNIVSWLNQNHGNLYDPDILAYPTLRVLCAYNSQKKPVAYLPTQRALFLESLAPCPDASRLTLGQACRDLVKNAELLASMDKIREIYMVSTDERILGIAEKHGFERLPYPLVRLKL